MKNPPKDWPRISSSVFYDDAAAAIAWLVRVFGFEVQLKVEGEQGQIIHSQLTLYGGLIMVGQAGLTGEASILQVSAWGRWSEHAGTLRVRGRCGSPLRARP